MECILLLLYILTDSRFRSLSHCLSEHCHKLAIATQAVSSASERQPG
jgi:hypothetical protein